MTPVEVHLVAYDVLLAALDAGSIEAAVEPMRLDLEVLSRENLIRVSMALAAESALVLTPRSERGRLRMRVEGRRLQAQVMLS